MILWTTWFYDWPRDKLLIHPAHVITFHEQLSNFFSDGNSVFTIIKNTDVISKTGCNKTKNKHCHVNIFWEIWSYKFYKWIVFPYMVRFSTILFTSYYVILRIGVVEGMMGCLNQFKWKIEINSPKRQVSWHFLMHVFKLLAFTQFCFCIIYCEFYLNHR